MHNVTQLLNAIDDGDRQAAGELLPLVYDELRKLAAARMAQENQKWNYARAWLREALG